MSANENGTTANETQPLDCNFNPKTGKIEQTFALCLILVVSLAGNIFIGIIVYKTKTMRKPINFLIVNMAMSDLLSPIFVIPRALTYFYADSWLISGHLGEALCKLDTFLQPVSMIVSVQSLVLIAVDRFGAVAFPLRSPLFGSKRCTFCILATWIIAMAIWSPYLFAFKLVEYKGGLECLPQWSEVFGEASYPENYFSAVTILFFFTPLAIVAVLYIMIFVKVKSQTIPGEQSANGREQRVKRETIVLKMSIAIVLGFAVCYLPNSIGFILIPHIRSCSFQYFSYVASLMMIVHCALNPCILFIFSENYRLSLKNILRCLDP